LSYGGRLKECLIAAEELTNHGLSTTVADARFSKPLDKDLIYRLSREHEVLITIEEGSIGGFASQVLSSLAQSGLLDNGLKIRTLTIPDKFFDHDSPEKQYTQAGLTSSNIVATALSALGRKENIIPVRA
jgi:1-deoxy-D-xylulose-5-phosphate synthase